MSIIIYFVTSVTVFISIYNSNMLMFQICIIYTRRHYTSRAFTMQIVNVRKNYIRGLFFIFPLCIFL